MERGGLIAGVTAEPPGEAHRARGRLQLEFDSLSAPSHELARKYGLTISPHSDYPNGLDGKGQPGGRVRGPGINPGRFPGVPNVPRLPNIPRFPAVPGFPRR